MKPEASQAIFPPAKNNKQIQPKHFPSAEYIYLTNYTHGNQQKWSQRAERWCKAAF